jgi:hypothetical protein
MFDIYLPRSKKVIFVADARECPELRPPEVIQDFQAFWHKTRNLALHEFNQVLFEVMWERRKETPNMNGFIDADKISCPLVCTWHSDGGHMVRIWYAKMARYILESLCANP